MTPQLTDSVMSGAFTNVTRDQIEATRKLHVIGWKWNAETVQKGKLRLKLQPDGEYKIGSTILIAEIEPNGAVMMGPNSGGFDYRRKKAA